MSFIVVYLVGNNRSIFDECLMSKFNVQLKQIAYNGGTCRRFFWLKSYAMICLCTYANLLFYSTGWVRLIRSHSSARFCFELSGNSNYNINLLLHPLICD